MALSTAKVDETVEHQLIYHLSRHDNAEVRRILASTDPRSIRDDRGMTLLHHTAISGNDEIARYLVERGCDVDAASDHGVTPLPLAVELKRAKVIRVLLDADADIHLRAGCRQSPLEAVLHGCEDAEVVRMFLERLKGDSEAKAKVLLEAKCPLPRALLLRDTDVTRHMLECGSGVDEVDALGDTALHCAVREMDARHVKLLVDHGANVNVANGSLQTPLHLYSSQTVGGSREILRTLLDRGAALDVRDGSGWMAVTRIFASGDGDILKMILEYDVDLNATNANGTTLLHYAALIESPVVVELFRGKNFEVNARDARGETPLWYAVESATWETLKFLLDNGADVKMVDDEGYTAFFQGFYLWVDMKDKVEDCLRCVEVFLQHGVDVDCVDKSLDTIFDYALECNNFVLVRPILEYVAMGEAVGQAVATNEIFLSKIDSHEKFRSHFKFCKRKIEKMKRVVVFETVTLFKFLKDEEGKLEKYARNRELTERLKRIVYGMRRSKLYFVKILRKRVDKAIKAARLREEAAVNLLRIEGLDKNDHVAEKILAFLRDEDLRNVCLI